LSFLSSINSLGQEGYGCGQRDEIQELEKYKHKSLYMLIAKEEEEWEEKEK